MKTSGWGLLLTGATGASLLWAGYITWPMFGRPTSQSEIDGIYLSNNDVAIDQYVFFPNGRYMQNVMMKHNGEILSAGGDWEFDRANSQINLKGTWITTSVFPEQLNPNYSKLGSGVGNVPVMYRGGHLLMGSEKFETRAYWKLR